MSSNTVKGKRNVPGPQSASMIRYLEELANSVCASQLEERCSSCVLSPTDAVPKPKKQTIACYFVRK